jgi:hypothetical protein
MPVGLRWPEGEAVAGGQIQFAPFGNVGDDFSLLLGVKISGQKAQVGLNVVVGEFAKPHWNTAGGHHPLSYNLDRTSRSLRSGLSISAQLKKGVGKADWKEYDVQIIIHTDGSLPWPDLDSELIKNNHTKLLEEKLIQMEISRSTTKSTA